MRKKLGQCMIFLGALLIVMGWVCVGLAIWHDGKLAERFLNTGFLLGVPGVFIIPAGIGVAVE